MVFCYDGVKPLWWGGGRRWVEYIEQFNFTSFSGLELTGHGSCEITNTLSKLKFIKVDSHYRCGLPFFGQVKYLFNISVNWGMWLLRKWVFVSQNQNLL